MCLFFDSVEGINMDTILDKYVDKYRQICCMIDDLIYRHLNLKTLVPSNLRLFGREDQTKSTLTIRYRGS